MESPEAVVQKYSVRTHYEVLRVITSPTRVTMRYCKTLREVLEDTNSRAVRSYDIPWHCKNNKIIQGAIIG